MRPLPRSEAMAPSSPAVTIHVALAIGAGLLALSPNRAAGQLVWHRLLAFA
jgi:hypothetical protein